MEDGYLVTIAGQAYTVRIVDVSRSPALVEVNGQLFEGNFLRAIWVAGKERSGPL